MQRGEQGGKRNPGAKAEMGACLSSATKVSGSSSRSNAASSCRDPAPRRREQKKRHEEEEDTRRRKEQDENVRQRGRERMRGMTGLIPCGKRTNFGYARDFENRYAIGKLLGHGQFGYTFVATDMAKGERVAVKRIDKKKVNWSVFVHYGSMRTPVCNENFLGLILTARRKANLRGI